MSKAIIQGEASDLRSTFERLCLPRGNDYLFHELYLRFRADGNVLCAVQDERQSAFLQAVFRPEGIKAGDGAEVKFDATEFLDILARFEGQVSIEFGDGNISIHSDGKQATIQEVDVKMAAPKTIPSVEDGVVVWKNGTVKSDCIATLDMSEFQGIVQDARTLDVMDIPLTFSPDGSSAELSTLESDGKDSRIETTINAKVQGSTASTTVGAPLAHVAANVIGEVEVHTVAGADVDWPIAVRKTEEDGTFLYIITSRMTS